MRGVVGLQLPRAQREVLLALADHATQVSGFVAFSTRVDLGLINGRENAR